jgi:hypothetical protein
MAFPVAALIAPAAAPIKETTAMKVIRRPFGLPVGGSRAHPTPLSVDGQPTHVDTMRNQADDHSARRSVTLAELGRPARLWRVVHASWSVAQLACLGYIWMSAFTGRRSPRLWASVAFLTAEGAALAVGRGNCPVGPMQAEWGDPVPFFELVLPPRAAKAAIPILTAVSLAGIAALILRRPGLVARSRG